MFELTTLEAALSASMMVLPRLKRLLPSVRALIHSQIQSVLPQDPQLPPPPLGTDSFCMIWEASESVCC